jgi:serine/threonine protein kinase
VATTGPSSTEGRRYRVISALGRGGFGTVFHAEMLGSGGFSKHVALKVLNPEVEGVEEIASRLRDEGRILGRLRHRAIVRVDGLVNFDGRWAVVMEYIEGADLRLLLEEGPIPLGPTLEILSEVASALDAAYNKATVDGQPLRLLHRDLKPGNIQITPTGEVKVLDFGIARADFDTREATTLSLRFGSLPYMSPERLDFIDSHAGDIYALGAILYEMLVGRPLGKTSANVERHEAILNSAVEALSARNPGDDVLELAVECLSYDPGARPGASELYRRCRELRRSTEGQWLSDWAEENVGPLIANRKTLDDELCGSVLTEDSGFNLIDSGSLRAGSSGARRVSSRPTGSSSGRRVPDSSHETFVLDDGAAPTPAILPVPQPEETAEPAPAARPRRRTGLWIGAALLGTALVGGLISQGFGDGEAPIKPAESGELTPELSGDGGQEAADGGAGEDEDAGQEGAGDEGAGDGGEVDPEGTDDGAAPGDEGAATDDGAGDEGAGDGGAKTDAVNTGGADPEGSAQGDGGQSDGGQVAPTDGGASGTGADPGGGQEEPDRGEDDGGEDGGAQGPAPGVVAVTGDASAVWLVGADGQRRAPGEVPPGSYAVMATFPDKGEISTGSVTVASGQRVELECHGLFWRCTPAP